MKPARPLNYISKYLVQNGTSNPAGDVNGSGTPVDMVYKPTGIVQVRRLIIYIASTANVAQTTYGDIATLGNGVEMFIKDSSDATIVDITDGLPIKSNDHYSRMAYDARQNIFAANPRSITARLSFFKDVGELGITIDGIKGEYFCVTINDNLTTLLAHNFRIAGRTVDV